MLRRLLPIAFLSTMAGCTEQGTIHQTSIAEARSVLARVDVPPRVFGSQPPSLSANTSNPAEIVWVARQGGRELFRYVAALSEAGKNATRIKLDLTPPKNDPSGTITKKLAENPAIKELYVVAMEENIAAALEKRPFRMEKINAQMLVAGVANMKNLQANLDEAVIASERLEKSHPRLTNRGSGSVNFR